MPMGSYEAALAVITRLREAGYIALLNGGCVRDRLLGIDPKDHDVATDAPPAEVRKLFRRTRAVGVQFGVVLVRIKKNDVEVATFRSDMEYHDGRRPSAVEFTTPERDAQRRDFTINGMFLDPVTDEIIDYVGGREDLEARVIRCIGEPHQRFAEDHLRMLRAVRFAARLDFEIEETTFRAMAECAARLRQIAPERIRMELEMILGSRSRARGWRLMCDTGLTDHLPPDRAWSAPEQARVERVLAALPEDASAPLGLAALFSGWEPAEVRQACAALRCSNADTDAITTTVATVPRLLDGLVLELADIKELLATGLFREMTILARAVGEADSMDRDALEQVVQRAVAIPAETVAPPPLLTGDDLLAMRLRPSPLMGRLLAEVYRAQRNETIRTREEAVRLVEQRIREGDAEG
jgi:poly(A) polymerase